MPNKTRRQAATTSSSKKAAAPTSRKPSLLVLHPDKIEQMSDDELQALCDEINALNS